MNDETNTLETTPTESSINQELVTEPQQQPVTPPPAESPVHRNVHRKLIAIITLCIILLVAIPSAVWFVARDTGESGSTNRTNQHQTNIATVPANNKKICFMRLAHIACVDPDGIDRVRYDLPVLQNGQIATQVVASADQSKYLVLYQSTSTSTQGPNTLWLLNNKLEPQKQLKLDIPPGLGQFAFTRDGKTVILGVNDTFYSPVLYTISRYDLASDHLSIIKKLGLGVSRVAATKDNHIVYSYWDGSRGIVHVMDVKGTNDREIDLSPIHYVSGGSEFTYDTLNDRLFFVGTIGDENIISHFHLAFIDALNLLNGGKVKVISPNPSTHYDWLFGVGPDAYAGFSGSTLSLLDKNGSMKTDLARAGVPVGLLTVSSFPKSGQQIEQISDLIAGYSSTPEDFQTFIENKYNHMVAECSSPTNGELDPSIIITGVVRDTFIRTSESCNGVVVFFYKRVQGQWIDTGLYRQSASPCTKVNEYQYTKELIEQCESNGQIINNTNP